MKGRRPATRFRATFEILEGREMMASDTHVAYGSSAFLASAIAGQDDVPAAVGGLYLKLASTSTVTIAPTTPVAPAPVTPAPSTPTPTPSTTTTQPNDWFTANLHDLALRNLTRQDATDGVLSRQDMFAIFHQATSGNTITADEYHDLKLIVTQTSFFTSDSYVQALSEDVVLANAANAHWEGLAFGNLGVGSSGDQLNMLVAKWFQGVDHPTTMAGVTYQQATGTLFAHAPSYSDVHQGIVGDCYLLSSLAETALVNPTAITSMFIANGDGTYTVRFNNNGKPDYVTVDSMLPVDSRGNYIYDGLGQNARTATTLWVALAEKAYAQINEEGWLRTDPADIGRNSYAAISGGYMFDALNQITGMARAYSSVNVASFTNAYNAGEPLTFGTVSHPVDSSVVGNHAYAVVGYNRTTQQVTLFNPWGLNNGAAPALVTLTWAQMQSDFFGMEYAV